jgi:teichoic acid transport system ATP-binding protein
MEKTAIKISNVTKMYKLYKSDKARFFGLFSKKIPFIPKLAVNDISLKINAGESVAILGRNGAGKSTLLKMITGVVFPTKGNIEVNGQVSALLELTAGFDQEFTGRENIYLKGRLMGLKDEDIQKLEQKIIDFADIGDYIDQPVREYSSGMKARVGFSISANINPEILIIDEVLSVGDQEFRQKCNALINSIVSKDNVTVLYVTHSIGSAQEMAERGIVLEDGNLLFDGEIKKAVEFYENTLK